MKHVNLTHAQWWYIILGVSVLLRLGTALYLGDVAAAPALLVDQKSYHTLGARIVEGHGFTFPVAWYPFTPPDTPTSHWSFLYSLFVAGIYALFGPHPMAVRLIQGLAGGLLLPWLVARWTRRLFPRECNLPIIAAGLAAGYGYFLLYAATLMTETFFILALLWSLETSVQVQERLTSQRSIPAGSVLQLGVSLGVAALLRQSILPWIPVLFAWLLWLGYRSGEIRVILPRLMIVGVIVLAFILPWTYRNYRVHDTFLLLNSNTGYAMYAAQHPRHGTDFQAFMAVPIPDELYGQSEAVLDRTLLQRGIQFVLKEPKRYLLLSWSRVGDLFEFWPKPDTTLLHNLGRVGSFGILLPLLLYGIYDGVKQLRHNAWESSGLLLLGLFAAFYTGIHLLTWAMVRYRLPVDAVMLPIAGITVKQLLAWLQRQRTRLRDLGMRPSAALMEQRQSKIRKRFRMPT